MLNYNVLIIVLSNLIKLEVIIPLFESDRHFGAVFCKHFDIQLQNENFETRNYEISINEKGITDRLYASSSLKVY